MPRTIPAPGVCPSWLPLDAQRRYDLHRTDHIDHSCHALTV
jgi:hypothetical protein